MLRFVQLRILPVRVTLRVSFNYQSNPRVMNPVLSFTVSRGKSRDKFVFLLDSEAQFSSICKEAVEKYVDEVSKSSYG